MLFKLIDFAGIAITFIGLLALINKDLVIKIADMVNVSWLKKMARSPKVVCGVGVALAIPGIVWWHLLGGVIASLIAIGIEKKFKNQKVENTKAVEAKTTTDEKLTAS